MSDQKRYNEIRMLIQAYANRLSMNAMSYADLIETLERLAELKNEAVKAWGNR